MPELVPLGTQIFLVMRVWCYFDRHVLHNFKTITHQANALLRIIGNKPDLRNTKVVQDLRTNTVVAIVHIESKLEISFHSIESLLLQFIGPQFIEKTDATPLLFHIQYHTFTFFLNHLHGIVKLRTTVASARTEYIARYARRMNAYQNRLIFFPGS